RHSSFAPRTPTVRQPDGTSRRTGQIEYCSSSLTTTSYASCSAITVASFLVLARGASPELCWRGAEGAGAAGDVHRDAAVRRATRRRLAGAGTRAGGAYRHPAGRRRGHGTALARPVRRRGPRA